MSRAPDDIGPVDRFDAFGPCSVYLFVVALLVAAIAAVVSAILPLASLVLSVIAP